MPYTKTPLAPSVPSKKSRSAGENIYVFNINRDDGFILVSGDDLATPILGYSFNGAFNMSEAPPNLKKWIEGYVDQIRYIRHRQGDESGKIKEQWEQLSSQEGGYETNSTSAAEPLITTSWSQSPYVNELCPYDREHEDYVVTGCVATAMAQIMKFWSFPESGSGFHSYDHSQYGMLSANFGNTTYDWAAMPEVVESENVAVATLMYHCGVSVEMNYGIESSGAYTNINPDYDEPCAELALEKYFAYDEGIQSAFRSDYTSEEWVLLLKTELDAGRPVLFSGYGSEGGGHAFICDGYDVNEFFHFNWGWGGIADGYFAHDALNPEGGETGEGYNKSQAAIIGIKPGDKQSAYNLALDGDIILYEDSIEFMDVFGLSADVRNLGESDFTTDFAAIVFDDEGNFVDFVETKEDVTLESGTQSGNTLDFLTLGSSYMLPRDYFVNIFYRDAEEQWNAVPGVDYQNVKALTVYYSADIELYSSFVIDSGPDITHLEPFTVTADILYEGPGSFQGEFAIDLMEMSGDFAGALDEVAMPSIDSGLHYSAVEFASEGLSVAPGSYLMALYHKPDQGSWNLSGSSYFPNPVKVIVRQAPLEPDIYEVNDSVDMPCYLPLDFTGNTGRTSTEGSNSHVGSDTDYYWISLEEGFNYTIKPRVHDAFSSGNLEEYTCDMIWSYYIYNVSEDWGELYDDVMYDSITLSDGGDILFWVAPYFEGGTGTYLLDIEASRTEATAIDNMEHTGIQIYPNPVSGILNIRSDKEIEGFEVIDTHGRILRKAGKSGIHSSMDVSMLQEGVYFLRITRQGLTSVHKIIKQ